MAFGQWQSLNQYLSVIAIDVKNFDILYVQYQSDMHKYISYGDKNWINLWNIVSNI